MKRNSPIYLEYLEALVISLLDERKTDNDINGIDFTNKPVSYSPYNVRSLIADVRTDLITLANEDHGEMSQENILLALKNLHVHQSIIKNYLTSPNGIVRSPSYEEWNEDHGLGYKNKLAWAGRI